MPRDKKWIPNQSPALQILLRLMQAALSPLRPKGIITVVIIESHQAGTAHGILTKADRQA